jgi:O-antigen/teichoic acid export membrane protein
MSNARRVARNTLANWAGLVANTLILLLLTPYVLGVLGKERFGVYVVAQQALIFVNLLTLGMRAGMNRFTARDVFAEDAERLNHTLSTVFLFHVGIGVVGLLIFAGLGLVAPSFFGIQRDFVRETVLLFAAVGLNFLLDLIGFTYRGLLVGHQRFDLLNVGMILQSLIRAGFVVAIFTLGWGRWADSRWR